MMDELAALAAGQDPVSFRLDLLAGHPRHRRRFATGGGEIRLAGALAGGARTRHRRA
jgi:hypothetical protein